MTSYFEIGGHVFECETTPQSSLPVSRIPMMHSREAADSRIAGGDARPSPRAADSRKSLFQHWKDTSFHGISEFSELSRRESIALVRKPYLFGLWGVGVQLEVIEMHHDYFLGV